MATFHRMPWVFHIYTEYIRKTHNTWMGTPWGVFVPRELWDSGDWKLPKYQDTRDHEGRHVSRSRNRPWLSRVWWTIHYNLSWKMRLDEEAAAFSAEVPGWNVLDIRTEAWNFGWALSRDYGIPKTHQECVDYLLARVSQDYPGVL